MFVYHHHHLLLHLNRPEHHLISLVLYGGFIVTYWEVLQVVLIHYYVSVT